MTDILQTLNNYILDNVLTGSGIDTIYLDQFPAPEGDFLISRHDPSTAKTKEFIDGSSTGTLQIAYYMRSADPVICRTVLNEIIKQIDGKTLKTADAVFQVASQTLPSFVAVDEKENSIYTAEISAEYQI